MNDPIVWGSVIAFIGFCASAITVIKFWMDRGRADAEAKSAGIVASTASAKVDLLEAAFNQYKVEAAEKFATYNVLSESERRQAVALGDSERRLAVAVDGMRSEFHSLGQRLDRFLENMIHPKQ